MVVFMEANEIKALVEQGIDDSEVMVQVEGNKCHLIVISPAFEGLRAVKKQQLVYGCLNDKIQSGELHAVSMQTFTPAEWEQHSS